MSYVYFCLGCFSALLDFCVSREHRTKPAKVTECASVPVPRVARGTSDLCGTWENDKRGEEEVGVWVVWQAYRVKHVPNFVFFFQIDLFPPISA